MGRWLRTLALVAGACLASGCELDLQKALSSGAVSSTAGAISTLSLTQLSLGASHGCALLSNGRLKCWGSNSQGEDLAGSQNLGDEPGEMGDALGVLSLGGSVNSLPSGVSALHGCVILAGGSVKCWGANARGQLGYGDAVGLSQVPAGTVSLGFGRTAKALALGGNHTCAILDTNAVKCWGGNDTGQLGYGDKLDRGDNVGEMGDFLPVVNLGAGRTAKKIAANTGTTCAVLDNDTVKCWGLNVNGQLGQGDTLDRGDAAGEMGDALAAVNLGTGRTAKEIVLGYRHVCAILDNNSVKCWGLNQFGVHGQGDTDTRGDAGGEMGDALSTVDLGTGRTAVSITSGRFHACAVLDNGRLKCWGYNFGQLGLGDTSSRGDGPGEMGDNLPYVDLGTGRTVTATRALSSSTCALLDNGQIKCWGDNYYGALGLGNRGNTLGDGPGEMGDALPALALGTGRTAVALGGGDRHTCAQLDDASVKCWGDFSYGQTGYGHPGLRGDGENEMGASLSYVDLGAGRTVKSLALPLATHSCAILDNGGVKCWGRNYAGTLGLGDSNSRGDDAGESGDSLPYVELGTGRTAKQVAPTLWGGCALLDNDRIKCWGLSIRGMPAYGDTQSRGDQPGEMGDNLPYIDLGTGRTPKRIFSRGIYLCVILMNDDMTCFGYNDEGTLGLGDTNSRGDAPGEMGDNLPLTPVGTGRKVSKVGGGIYHLCAILDNATLKCWGNNWYGQLGLGDANHRGDSPGEMGDNLPAVDLGTGLTPVEVVGGYYHTCVLFSDGRVKCFGYNLYGQLGVGHKDNLGDDLGEMGDALPFVDLGAGRRAVALTAGAYVTCATLDNGKARCWGSSDTGAAGTGDGRQRGDEPGEMGDNIPYTEVF